MFEFVCLRLFVYSACLCACACTRVSVCTRRNLVIQLLHFTYFFQSLFFRSSAPRLWRGFCCGVKCLSPAHKGRDPKHTQEVSRSTPPGAFSPAAGAWELPWETEVTHSRG